MQDINKYILYLLKKITKPGKIIGNVEKFTTNKFPLKKNCICIKPQEKSNENLVKYIEQLQIVYFELNLLSRNSCSTPL